MSGFIESDDPIYDGFRKLDDGTKDALASIEYPLQQGIAALTLAEDRFGAEYLTTEQISNALECAGVAVSPTQLEKAFSRAKGRVSRRKSNGETWYKVMTPGRREVEPLLESGNIKVLYVDSGRPRTARRKLGEILSELQGLVRVCDPYCGLGTLDSLEMIPEACEVEFLTLQKVNSAKLDGPLEAFRRERKHTELRKLPSVPNTPSEIHDRYVLSGDKVLIVGHGLMDIGGKESFVITLEKSLVPDLFEQLRQSFDEKWGRALPL